MQTVRGVYNEPRNVAMYLIRSLRKDGLLLISQVFGLRGYSSTGSVIERIKARLETGAELGRHIGSIRRQIVGDKSQTET
jgi:chromosomal replication initiation ATPase DnaA